MTYGQAWRRTRSAGRRRAGARPRVAAAFALLLAGSLAAAGCGASGSGSSDRAAAPAGVSQNGGSAADAGTPPAVATGGTPEAGNGGAAAGGGRTTPAPTTYLVRTATLSVRTAQVRKQLDAARQDAVRAGGYAGDENTTVDAHGHARSTVQLRVPPAGYDRLLAELGGLGQLLDREVKVQDVTGKVVDVASRVKSQQASVDRVRGLMDKATDLTDVVSLEGELSTRESALESLEAQQQSLKSQTNLATITLRLSEPPARQAPPKSVRHDGFWTVVGHALGHGWHAFYLTLRVLLVVLSVALPFLAVAVLGTLAYRLLRRWLPGAAPVREAAHPSLRAPRGTPTPKAAAAEPEHPPVTTHAATAEDPPREPPAEP
jgi:hypothetical protein